MNFMDKDKIWDMKGIVYHYFFLQKKTKKTKNTKQKTKKQKQKQKQANKQTKNGKNCIYL